MWKTIVETGRPQTTIQYGACALHVGYLRLQTQATIHNFCFFLLQQWLHERASMLRHMYTVFLLQTNITSSHIDSKNKSYRNTESRAQTHAQRTLHYNCRKHNFEVIYFLFKYIFTRLNSQYRLSTHINK